MNSHNEIEHVDIKHEKDPLPMSEIKSEPLDIECEVKVEEEEFGDIDVKNEILPSEVVTSVCNVSEVDVTQGSLHKLENYGKKLEEGKKNANKDTAMVMSLEDTGNNLHPFDLCDLLYMRYSSDEVNHPSTTNEVKDEKRSTRKQVTTPSETENGNNGSRWTDSHVLSLIDNYKKNLDRFKSPAVRNDVVWKRVADEVKSAGGNFSPKQCEFKFKYLKKKYFAKVDNIKSAQSGGSTMYFQYFEQFNELFGIKPNVQQVKIAASSRGVDVDLGGDNDDDDTLETDESTSEVIVNEVVSCGSKNGKEPPSKKTKLEILLSEFIKISKVKEEENERRHKELLQVQREALKIFTEKMDKLLDKL